MAYQKISTLPDNDWVEIVSGLRWYFEPEDFEWEAYAKIFGVGFSQRLVELNDLCADYVPPPAPPTLTDYQTGAYKEILWKYALAAKACDSCEDA